MFCFAQNQSTHSSCFEFQGAKSKLGEEEKEEVEVWMII